MIRAKLLVSLAAAAAVLGGLAAYRWANPCPNCPMSMAIGVFGGPSGCAPAPPTTTTTPTTTPATARSSSQATILAANADPKSPMSTPPSNTVKTETAMFGAGCFWGVEATFRKIPGVVEAVSGYSGGRTKNATYKEVCTDATGHAEVVQIQFDPTKVSYQTLVEKFFKLHDPTQVNRQGPDYGSQYRSAIFFYSPEQQKTAEAVKQKLAASGKHKSPIATEITRAGEFYRAEEYHQRYLEKHGLDNCHIPSDD
jgi:peptide-methionine (S)-S-oxide reductase